MILTGASSGIGRELALLLGRQGARLILTARREHLLRQVVQEIDAHGGQAVCLSGDIAHEQLRDKLVEAAVRHYDGLDLLINNAGIGARGPFESADPKRLRQIMEVNFFAPVELIRRSIPDLIHGVQPMVVNIGSVLGQRAVALASEYCASKFAMQGFSDSLRLELSRHGVDLLVVNPSTTQTDFFDNMIQQEGEDQWSKRPSVTPQYVAGRIVRAISQGRREIIPSFSGRMLCWLNRLSPSLLDRFLRQR